MRRLDRQQGNPSQPVILIRELIGRGALFVVNHSGGKDSQTMTIELRELIPEDQLLIIHAHLPEVEWEGTWEHIQNTCKGLAVLKTQSRKTFFEMVNHRQMFPGPAYRQCTSDLKRGPIEKVIRGFLRVNRHLPGLIVNCMGIRAEESSRRAKLSALTFNKRNSKVGREWYDWLPIFDYKLKDVWTTIERAGQKPHWAYAQGMSRLSCCFCIMANAKDLTIAARLKPALYRKYVLKEREIAFTLQEGKTLEDTTGVKIDKGELCTYRKTHTRSNL